MKKWFPRAILYAVLILFATFFLMPLYVLLATSLKPFEEVSLAEMWRLPRQIDFSGYTHALKQLAPNFLNTVYIVVPSVLLSAFLGSMNAYVLSKWPFKGSEWIFVFLLFGMFIPFQSILIPLIQTIQKLGLYNTIPGLVLVHSVYGIAVTTLMFRNFYGGIPMDMIESAKMDGAGFFRIYRYIMAPLSIPGFVVVAIWQFTSIWNEFLFAVTITGTKYFPIMVALRNLAGSEIVEWNIQMAGAVLAALPTMLVYIFLGRYFIRGLYAGSVKG
jgi:ABC-type sugar transport system, permease component